MFTILWIYVKPCQAVLRLRESRSRNLSKQSADFTDDEDLGLPKSLQNSPGDFSDGLEVTSGSRVGPGWGTSRHHSSCSDNSLLSLDSFDNRNTNMDSDSRIFYLLFRGFSLFYHFQNSRDILSKEMCTDFNVILTSV